MTDRSRVSVDPSVKDPHPSSSNDCAPDKAADKELKQPMALSPEDIVNRMDIRQAGINFARFVACAKRSNCDKYSDISRLDHVIESYRELDEVISSRQEMKQTIVDSIPNSETLSDIFAVEGVVKWFDSLKGYGFITPNNGLPDILLHITCLRTAGYLTAHEGSTIRCDVIARPRGFQAFRILSIDESTAIHPSQRLQRLHQMVSAETDWKTVRVKWFSRLRGFGFLSAGDDLSDIFCDMETLRRSGVSDLHPAQVLEARLGMGRHGWTAAELRAAPSTVRPSH